MEEGMRLWFSFLSNIPEGEVLGNNLILSPLACRTAICMLNYAEMEHFDWAVFQRVKNHLRFSDDRQEESQLSGCVHARLNIPTLSVLFHADNPFNVVVRSLPPECVGISDETTRRQIETTGQLTCMIPCLHNKIRIDWKDFNGRDVHPAMGFACDIVAEYDAKSVYARTFKTKVSVGDRAKADVYFIIPNMRGEAGVKVLARQLSRGDWFRPERDLFQIRLIMPHVDISAERVNLCAMTGDFGTMFSGLSERGTLEGGPVYSSGMLNIVGVVPDAEKSPKRQKKQHIGHYRSVVLNSPFMVLVMIKSEVVLASYVQKLN